MKVREVISFKNYFDKFLKEQPKKVQDKIFKTLRNTADNIVFAKGGVEQIIEKPDAFSRNLLFILYFFVI